MRTAVITLVLAFSWLAVELLDEALPEHAPASIERVAKIPRGDTGDVPDGPELLSTLERDLAATSALRQSHASVRGPDVDGGEPTTAILAEPAAVPPQSRLIGFRPLIPRPPPAFRA